MAVEAHIDSGAGIVTMTDGPGGNRLNPELISGLGNAFDTFAKDSSVRFILLRSNGPAFSLGMDLNAFMAGDFGKSGADFRSWVQAYAGLLEAIHKGPKTVVGLIEGSVKAGGVGLAAACDVVIASEDADFELSELYLGLIPANVMPYILSTRMPMKRAAYLVQTAACIDAKTAVNWGLADEAHPADRLEKALKSLGRRLMRISPAATARQKDFARALGEVPAEQRGRKAVEELVDLAADPRILDAVQAFSHGELPSWFGNFRPDGPLAASTEES